MPGSVGVTRRIATRIRKSHTAELFNRTANIAGHLADNGVEPGDTVAIMLPNSVQWVEACFGITRAGALGVPISYDSSEPEIVYRLADAACKAVFTTAERADLFVKLQKDAPNLKTLIVTDRGSSSAKALRYVDLIGKAARSAPRDLPADARAVLQFFTRPALPVVPRASSSRCTGCCGLRPRAGDRSPAFASATRCSRHCRCSIPMRSIFPCS